jgi:hypothetical protein
MHESVEFRIPEENAAEFLPPGTGSRIGYGIRKVVVDVRDPLFPELRRVHQRVKERGGSLFAGWEIRRRYTRRELAAAELLYVWPKRLFAPAGEECGTVYDESAACHHAFSRSPATEFYGREACALVDACGVGARQVTPLCIDGRRLPSGTDFAQTIAGEIVVSRRVADVFRAENLSGAEFNPVLFSNTRGPRSDTHFQLSAVGEPVEISDATRAGSTPFDDAAYGRCPYGHLIGINLLSEVTVIATSSPQPDLMATRQMVGIRRGLLRPRPLLLFSPRAWRAVEGAKLSGLGVEVARLS